jgi:hypothetical protein
MVAWLHGYMEAGEMGRWGGGYMDAVMIGCRVAWLYGSRYGTPGKVHQLQIQNPKERCTTALIKIQDPMNLPPHSPFPHFPITPVWNMQNCWLRIPYYQKFVEFPIH